MTPVNRGHAAYWGFILHRFSGLCLALFLPFHFIILRLAIDNANAMDIFLSWTSNPLIALAEGGLIFLFCAHITGGIRLLVLEFLPWHNYQKNLVAISLGISAIFCFAFLLAGIDLISFF